MNIQIQKEDASCLPRYQEIPISFTVNSKLVPEDKGLNGILFRECEVENPYVKDYDAIQGEGPTRWLKRWDLSNWMFLSAKSGNEQLGWAAVAWNTPGSFMLEDRLDLAVLWDLRVHPAHRGKGVGRHLFAAAEEWAASKGCSYLKIETQNINVPACKFYQKQGCVLGIINKFAYPDLPEEVCLIWYKELSV